MQVFTCNNCKTQHPWGEVSTTNICDTCNKEITGSLVNCKICDDWDKTYHRECATKLGNDYFCKNHISKKRELRVATEVLKNYVNKFWEEFGDVSETSFRSRIKVSIPWLPLICDIEFLDKNGSPINTENDGQEVVSVKYAVQGIKSFGATKFVVKLHDHLSALEKVGIAILRSLRSKKASFAGKAIFKPNVNRINKTMAYMRKRLKEITHGPTSS